MAFWKKRHADTESEDPTLDTGNGLGDILAFVCKERDGKNVAAYAEFDLASAEDRTVDLPAATITFVLANHIVVGDIELLGSHAPVEHSWMWGWFQERLPNDDARSSLGVLEFGKERGVETLTHPVLTVDEAEADQLAAFGFSFSGAELLERVDSPAAHFYFAVSSLRRRDRG
jgi:hypothetical protein